MCWQHSPHSFLLERSCSARSEFSGSPTSQFANVPSRRRGGKVRMNTGRTPSRCSSFWSKPARMKPKTMLEMAGLTPVPPPLSDSTIVVIDAQREYVDGKLPLAGIEPALAEIGRLLGRARALQVPIIHIVHQGRTGGAFAPGSPGFEIASPATPAPGEAVVHKSLPNAFASTDLASRLAALKKGNVVL